MATSSQAISSSVSAVYPLTGYIGAEMRDIDLRTLSEEDAERIREVFHEHLVVFFPGQQNLSANELVRFAQCFGEIEPPHGGLEKHPDNRGVNLARSSRGAGSGKYNQVWHSDVSFAEAPPSVSILQAIEIPPIGGDTLFTSMYAAYETLSENLKQLVDGLEALHDGLPNFTPYLLDPTSPHGTERLQEMRATTTTAIHPVVRRHPETGRKALFVNRGFTVRIVGVSDIESRNLLNLLCDHAEQASLQVRWRWQTGDVAMWDNRCALHYASWDYGMGDRLMQRVTLKGDRPKS